MKRLTLVALIPFLLPVASFAQSSRAPGATTATRPAPRLERPKPAARSCAEFGAGCGRLEGSDTGVRIGGSLDIGTTSRGGR
jgi:hypothetical protein